MNIGQLQRKVKCCKFGAFLAGMWAMFMLEELIDFLICEDFRLVEDEDYDDEFPPPYPPLYSLIEMGVLPGGSAVESTPHSLRDTDPPPAQSDLSPSGDN